MWAAVLENWALSTSRSQSNCDKRKSTFLVTFIASISVSMAILYMGHLYKRRDGQKGCSLISNIGHVDHLLILSFYTVGVSWGNISMELK